MEEGEEEVRTQKEEAMEPSPKEERACQTPHVWPAIDQEQIPREEEEEVGIRMEEAMGQSLREEQQEQSLRGAVRRGEEQPQRRREKLGEHR